MQKSWLLGIAWLIAQTSAWAQLPVFTAKSAELGFEPVADMAHFYGHGAAVADYDEDGDLDFYLATTNGISDRLYQNQGDGQFVNVAAQAGLGIAQATRTALWFDYNGDHRLDLVVLGERCLNFLCGQPILVWLYEQQPDGTFVDVTAASGLQFGTKYDGIDVYAVGGIAAGDLNGDGYLDVFISVWGGQNSVFFNRGDGTFEDVSASCGMGQERQYYWQPMLHDFTSDGRLDVVCNVDFGPNEFYMNQGNGTFVEMASSVGAAVFNSEMGMTLGDYDNDGDFDIYATNITRTFAGQYQHNVLLTNFAEGGMPAFYESAKYFGVDASGWDWGTTFFELNNDGWLDLATTNGWNDPSWHPDQSKFWLNSGGDFTEHSASCQFNDSLSATTLLAFDLDRDGDQDLLQTLKENPGTQQPVVVYQNQLQPRANANYLVVQPRMEGANHFAIGAVVKVRDEAFFGMRLISAGSSFYGQEPAEAFFGLGARTAVREVEILWPDGTISVYPNVAANQVVQLSNTVIAPPTGVSGEIGEGSVHLSWTPQATESRGYAVQWSYDKDFALANTVELTADETDVRVPDVNLTTTAYFRVKALGETVHSAWSAPWSTQGRVTGLSEAPTVDFSLYPNPSQGAVTLTLTDHYAGEVSVTVHSLLGQTVSQSTFYKAVGEINYPLSLTLPSGQYWVSVCLGDRIAHRRLWLQE